MTRSDANGFAAAAVTTVLFIPYAAWAALRIEAMGGSWFGIAFIFVVVLTAPMLWTWVWAFLMRLMGERL
jgi:hypothetical protein